MEIMILISFTLLSQPNIPCRLFQQIKRQNEGPLKFLFVKKKRLLQRFGTTNTYVVSLF